MNKPVSKDEFQKIKADMFSSYSALESKLRQFRKLVKEQVLHKFLVGDHNLDVSGNFIYSSKNVHASFFVSGGENEKFAVVSVKGQKDSMDIYGVNGGELGYESNNVDFSSQCFFSVNGENNLDNDYCVDSFSVEHAFGCIALRKKKFCVLNKQYDESTYEGLKNKIIAQMKEMPFADIKGRTYGYGELFPIELSPFTYNETIAQEYAPISKKQAEELGYPWYETGDKEYVATKRWDELPESIAAVDDSILKETILCEAWDEDKEKAKEHKCTKAFRLIPAELQMYKKFGLPLPRKCPNTRNFEKSQMRNPCELWSRRCNCAGKAAENGKYQNTAPHSHGDGHCEVSFETSYAPDRPEIVYCEQCYQQEVV